MIAPLVLFLISLAGVAVAMLQPDLSDLLLLAGPSAIASLYLLLRYRRPTPPEQAAPPKVTPRRFAPKRHKTETRRWIVIDGSNVMHWKDNTPSLDTLKEVIARLHGLGFDLGVVFDANVGYKTLGRYVDDAEMARVLGLDADQTLVVPKGSIADTTVLAAARDIGGKVLSNDRYRDWVEDFPEVATPGHLVRGGYHNGALWLERL